MIGGFLDQIFVLPGLHKPIDHYNGYFFPEEEIFDGAVGSANEGYDHDYVDVVVEVVGFGVHNDTDFDEENDENGKGEFWAVFDVHW